MTKTIIKAELLDWLRINRDNADPPTALVLEDVITVIESGALDNSKVRTVKIRTPCEHCQRNVMFAPYDDNNPGDGEYIVYHDCRICARDTPCIHPARYCAYKVEEDQFSEYFVKQVKKAIS